MDRYQGNNQTKPIGTLESTATCAGVALLAGVVVFALLLILGGWSWLQAIFGGIVVFLVLLPVLALTIGRPSAPPAIGGGEKTAPTARADAAGMPGQAAQPLTPRNLNAPSPHRDGIEPSAASSAQDAVAEGSVTDRAISPGPDGTPSAEPAPATRIPAPAPVNASEAGVARPVGATTDPKPMVNPKPLDGKIVSPEAPDGKPADIDRNDAAAGNRPAGGPAGTASTGAQSYNETDAAAARAATTDSGSAKRSDGAGATDRSRAGTAEDPPRAADGGTGGTGAADGVSGSAAGSGTAGTSAGAVPRTAGASADAGVAAGSGGAAGRGATSGPSAGRDATSKNASNAGTDPSARTGAAAGGPDGDAMAVGSGATGGAGGAAGGPSSGSAAEKAAAAADAGPTSEASKAAAKVAPGDERRPSGMDAPRGGTGDDLKKIKGVGPALEKKCNDMGIWHFDQIAAWSGEEVAWADQNLVRFKGRVSRDDWVTQARILADGGQTGSSGR